MCGLVGIYSSNMERKHEDALSALLYLDTWRGRDSTGVAAIRKNADTEVLKATIPGYEFVEGPKLGQHLHLTDFCWIGHNRYGTIGKNIKTNSHPFMVDDEDGCCILVGAHNGTLKSKYRLPNHASYGTDSEALYNSIATEGLEKTLEELEGAWALTWYDHVEEELRFLRNNERPLFYAWEEGRKTLIWASEMWMIRVACSRNKIKLEDDKVYSVAEDTLYRVPVPLKHNEELTMHRKGGLVGKQTPNFFRMGATGGAGGQTTQQRGTTTTPQTNQRTGQTPTGKPLVVTAPSPSSQSGTSTSTSGGKQTQTSGTSSPNLTVGNVRNILSAKTYKGYGGKLLSKRELEDQLENGCAWCEEEFIGPEDRYAWLSPERPVCHKCLTGQHIDNQGCESVSFSQSVH